MFRQTDVIPRFNTPNDYFRKRISERKSLLTNIGDPSGLQEIHIHDSAMSTHVADCSLVRLAMPGWTFVISAVL
jgi:hypothetical protein